MAKMKKFLSKAGWLLLVIGAAGYFAGDAVGSALGVVYSQNESIGYLVVGAVMLMTVNWSKNAGLARWLTMIVGLAGLILGIYGFMTPGMGANLNVSFETVDSVILLLVGAWGLWTIWGKR
ncbi:hypothetical protein CMI37_29115 [Candidatus Pacearchaeota archaeon]|jgi:hypothetical protein|nr:hypothetical protein [Candidatus Pacearchaeota archaeon]HCX45250.1 hypothetical protein [Patescibacteria group bacterium]|tara:strand:- start:2241 stop:2603 length:363 start_codon:yes stop_codon:yes gene_type:complete